MIEFMMEQKRKIERNIKRVIEMFKIKKNQLDIITRNKTPPDTS